MLDEIRKTLRGLAKVSRVVTHFQFSVAGAARDLEPVRFNNYVISSKEEMQELRDSLSDLKGSCDRVREHRDALNQQAGGDSWGWIGLLGEKREARRQELAIQLDDAYAIDQHIIDNFNILMGAATAALREVSASLGSQTEADPANVPKAARLLRDYAAAFEPLEDECIELAAELRQLIDALR